MVDCPGTFLAGPTVVAPVDLLFTVVAVTGGLVVNVVEVVFGPGHVIQPKWVDELATCLPSLQLR